MTDLEKELNDPNSWAMKAAHKYMEDCEKKYQRENPCPNCGSANVHLEPVTIFGPKSSWIEYCDDCDWKKETDCT
jgi:hypothetical protein